MKTIHVPKGTQIFYEELFAENIIVDGKITVSGKIQAKNILGRGIIEAETIVCRKLHADVIECTCVKANEIMAGKLISMFIYVKDSTTVREYLEAQEIKSPRIVMAQSKVQNVLASEIIQLDPKKRGILRMALAAWLKSTWLKWRAGWCEKSRSVKVKATDPELQALIKTYKEMKGKGYRVVLEPKAVESSTAPEVVTAG